MDQLTNRPDAQGSINIWAMLATVVITAVIAGGVTYYFQKTAFEAEKQSLQQQMDQLQTQISRLEQIKDVEKQEPVAKQQQESEDQYQDWKTYRSEKYGFEVQFPSECNITEGKQVSPFFAKISVKNCLAPVTEIIEIAVKDTFKGSGPYLGQNQQFKSYWDYGVNVVFGVNKWRKINYTESNQEFCWYIIQNNNNDYVIRWGSCDQVYITPALNKILTTFKFTN